MVSSRAPKWTLPVEDARVSAEPAEPGTWLCTITDAQRRVELVMVESAPGTGDWYARQIGVTAEEGASLTAAALRDAPYARWLRTAQKAVAQCGERGVRVGRASDPPRSFLEDRRGRTARAPEDYAHLAWKYLETQPDRRKELARHWADRFPGTSLRTWRNRLSTAKQYIATRTGQDGGVFEDLTDEGYALMFGDDWQEAFQIERTVDNAEHWLRLRDPDTEALSPAERQRARLEDDRLMRSSGAAALEQRRARAQQIVDEWYS